MSKEMDSLVEEISLFVTRNILHPPSAMPRVVSPRCEDVPIHYGRLEFRREDAEVLVTRIGKAYADGLPLRGEVGRGRLDGHGIHQDFYWDTGPHVGQAIGNYDYRCIALRLGTDTEVGPLGKEEEEK